MTTQPLLAAAASYSYQVPLSGQNTAQVTPGALQFTPATHDFGTLVLGSSSAVTATLSNTGQDSVALTGIGVSGPYVQTNDCPATLVGGASCTVSVTYTPTDAGTHDTLLVVGTQDEALQTGLPLKGAAVVPTTNLTLSANSVTFPATDVGMAAVPKTITITNAGNSPAQVTAVGVVDGMGDFNQTNDCLKQLRPNATCTVSVSFVPSAYGTRTGNLAVYEQASGTLYNIALNGSGNAPILTLAPGVLEMPSAIVDYSTSTLNATVTNTGNLTLHGLSFDTGSNTEFSVSEKTCTQSLPAGDSCTATVKFTPKQSGSRTGTLTAYSTDGGSASASLAGTGTAQSPSAKSSVSSLAFGNIPVGGHSAAQEVQFSNTGNVPVTLGSVTVTAGSDNYKVDSTDCGATLAVGASCKALVQFSPRAAGPLTGTVRADYSSGNLDVTLSGTGTLGIASLAPSSLSFPDQQAGTTSATKSVTLTNTGNRQLTVAGVTFTAGASDFSQTNTCSNVAPNGTCSIVVAFKPSKVGSITGQLSVAHDGESGTALIDLTGVGRAQGAALSTPSFAATPVGTTSTATATLSNTGIGPLAVTPPVAGSVTGAAYSLASSNCGTSVAVGAACTVTVQFAPTSTAPTSGTLSLNTGAGVQTVSFGSTGIQGYASVSPGSLTYVAQQVGTTSAVQTVTVTNTGTNTLTFTGVGISNGGSDFGQSNNCGAIPVNGSCTVSVTFTPAATGARSGTLAFTHNGGGIATVNLGGTGQAQSATLSTPSFGATAVGSSSTATATLANTGIGPLSVTVPTAASVTGSAYGFVSTTCGSSLAVAGTCTVTVQFNPANANAATGALTIATGAGNQVAALSATGIQGVAALSSTSLTYAAQQVGTTSPAQTVTLTNTGTNTLTVSGVTVSAGAPEFVQTNNCTAIPVNGTCTLSITFTPSATGARPGTVTIAHNGTGATSVTMSGTGQAQSATVSNVAMGAVNVGANGTGSATVTNTGIGPLSITVPTAGSVSGSDFSFVSTTCTTSLAPGATCGVVVKFTPTVAGARSGSLTVATGAGALTSNLSGTGNQAVLAFSYALGGTSVNWGNKQVGGSYNSALVTLTNSGNIAATSLVVNAPTNWSATSSNCTATLAAGASCTFLMTFSPSAAQSYSGSFTATAAVSTVTNSISVVGVGAAQSATLSTPSFPATPVNSSSTATATLANTGVGPLAVTVPAAGAVTGAGYSFVSTTCTSSLAVSGTCTVTVQFSPTNTAAASGTLTISTGAGNKAVSLGSTGIQGFASVSPGSLTYAAQQTSTSSTVQTVTVTNTGTNTLTFTGVGISAGNTDFAQSNNCGAVAVNGTCTVNVTFTPSTSGARAGTLAFTHDGGGIATVSLSGTGQAQSATLSNPAFPTTAVSANSTTTATLTNTGIGALDVTAPSAASVTGTDFSFVSTTCGTALAVGASCVTTVKFAPTATTARTGSLTISTGAGNQAASLSATGVQGTASLSSTSLTFVAKQIGDSSVAQTVTVTNSGTAPLVISGVAVTAGATDFTQASGTCTTLAVNATCTVSVTFTPTVAGTRNGTVTLTHNGNGSTSISLTGTGQGQSATLSSPSFGTTQVGNNSTAAATLTNTGIGSMTITAPTTASVTGTDFSFVSTTCGASLAAGASCTATVKFAPTSNVARTGSLTLNTSAGAQVTSLSATGVQGNASLSTGSLTFAAKQVGDSATAQAVTVTNNGTAPLTFSSVAVTSGATDFTQTSSTCTTLAVSGTCIVNVTFTPTTTGARNGVITLAHNGTGSTSISLAGTGQGQAGTLSVPSFPSTAVSSSNTATGTLTNTGLGALSVTVPAAGSVTGAAYSFVSTTCGTSLAVSATCTVTVRFSPSNTTPATGNLAVVTGAGTLNSALSATGIQGIASVSPGSLTFAARQTGTTSAAQTITLTNTGTNTLTVSSVTLSAGSAHYAQTNNCTAVAVNGTCAINVTFTPTAAGTLAGTVTLAHNGTGTTAINLTGTGQAPSGSLSSPTFPATAVGASSTGTSTLTNTGLGTLTVTPPTAASVTGTGYSFVSTTCGTSLAVSATCTVTVQFNPSSTTPASGNLAVVTGAGTINATLSSTGIQGYASMSPGSLTFAAQQTATTSAVQSVTVTNTGTNTLTFTGVGISSGSANFAQSNNCGSVPVNGTCLVSVTFTPSTTGTLPGTLTFTHNGGGTANVSLTGTGQAPSGSLSAPSFPATPVGATGNATATLTNTGVGALSITAPTAASVTGAAYSFVSTTCGASLAVGASCITTVKFSPTSTTAASGNLAIATGAGTLNATLSASGIQGAASVSPSSLTFAAQQTSTTSTVKTVTVTNTGTNTLTFTGVGISAGSTNFAQSNNCSSVAVNGTCTVSVTFTPTAAGALNGTLSFTHNGGGVTSVALSGTGQAPSASVTAGSFGNVATGQSAQSTVTLTNTGVGSITVTAPTAASVTGTGFSFVSSTCTGTLAAGGTCTATVSFSPTLAQAYTGSLTITSSAGSHVSSLTGTGIKGNASLSVASLAFGSKQVGDASAVQSVTVTNNGSNTLTFSSISLTAGSTNFSQTSSTCTSLAVNGTCTVNVTFTPSATGALSGTITLAHNGNGATSISLTGTGQAQSASIASPSFAATPVGSNSNANATVTNTGIGNITVTAPTTASVTGANYSFVSTTCGGVVAPSSTCTVTVKFSPTSTAAASGSLTVATTAGNQVATLGSTGIQGYATMSPGSLTFAAQQTGTTSATQTVTVTNTGTNTLTFTGVGISAGSANYAQSNNCASVAVNGTCSVTVSFTPSATGTLPGTLSFTHNGGGVANVSLTGTGQAPSASLSAPAFATTAVGSNSNAVSTLTNTGVGSITVTAPTAASVTGTDFSFVSTTCGTSLAAGANCTTTVKFAPTSTAARSGSLTIATSAGSRVASLSATGVQGFATLSPGSLTFANQTVSTTSSGQTVTITNTGTAPLTITGVGMVAGATDFNQTNTCGTTMAVNGSCAVTVAFTPSATGTRSGTIGFTSNGGGVSSFGVTGTGVAAATVSASFSPTAVAAGVSSTFTWSTANASSASVACSGNGAGSGSGLSGSITVTTSAQGSVTCTVSAVNAASRTTTGSAVLTVNPAYTYAWNNSAWSTPSACGSTTSTRTVWCQRSDGTTVADANCNAGTKPAATQAATDYSSCTYAWNYSGWSTPAGCGSVTATRSVWCQRSDGTTVADANCGTGKPASTQASSSTATCTYSFSYGSWSTPSGCGSVTQTRSATCYRSDGAAVSNSFCGTPTTSQSSTDYSSCTYSFSYGAWSTPNGCGTVTQTRSATCYRSDGTAVSNAYCGTPTTSQSTTNYNSCTYSFSYGGWGACSGSCGTTGTQSRSATCVRSDGSAVSDAYCGTPTTSQSCQMAACAKPPVYWDLYYNGYEPMWDTYYYICSISSPGGPGYAPIDYSFGCDEGPYSNQGSCYANCENAANNAY